MIHRPLWFTTAWVLGLCLLVASGCGGSQLVGFGAPLPELKAAGWIGDPVSAADLEGKVVVDAWAFW